MGKSTKITIENKLSQEEATKLWFKNKKRFPGDYVVFYIKNEPEEEDEDDDLITPLGESDIINEEKEKFTDFYTLIDAGSECKHAQAGESVIFNPAMGMNMTMIALEDNVFSLLPERSIAFVINK